MFSSFPGGGPGIGLLLLRVLLGGLAILQGVNSLTGGTLWFGVYALVTGALLLAGFLTPYAAALIGLAALDLAFTQTKWQPVSAFVVSIAIALLGPGAYSLDARLFGRREIIIPRSPDSGNQKP
jgi:hypothetical protein